MKKGICNLCLCLGVLFTLTFMQINTAKADVCFLPESDDCGSANEIPYCEGGNCGSVNTCNGYNENTNKSLTNSNWNCTKCTDENGDHYKCSCGLSYKEGFTIDKTNCKYTDNPNSVCEQGSTTCSTNGNECKICENTDQTVNGKQCQVLKDKEPYCPDGYSTNEPASGVKCYRKENQKCGTGTCYQTIPESSFDCKTNEYLHHLNGVCSCECKDGYERNDKGNCVKIDEEAKFCITFNYSCHGGACSDEDIEKLGLAPEDQDVGTSGQQLFAISSASADSDVYYASVKPLEKSTIKNRKYCYSYVDMINAMNEYDGLKVTFNCKNGDDRGCFHTGSNLNYTKDNQYFFSDVTWIDFTKYQTPQNSYAYSDQDGNIKYHFYGDAGSDTPLFKKLNTFNLKDGDLIYSKSEVASSCGDEYFEKCDKELKNQFSQLCTEDGLQSKWSQCKDEYDNHERESDDCTELYGECLDSTCSLENDFCEEAGDIVNGGVPNTKYCGYGAYEDGFNLQQYNEDDDDNFKKPFSEAYTCSVLPLKRTEDVVVNIDILTGEPRCVYANITCHHAAEIAGNESISAGRSILSDSHEMDKLCLMKTYKNGDEVYWSGHGEYLDDKWQVNGYDNYNDEDKAVLWFEVKSSPDSTEIGKKYPLRRHITTNPMDNPDKFVFANCDIPDWDSGEIKVIAEKRIFYDNLVNGGNPIERLLGGYIFEQCRYTVGSNERCGETKNVEAGYDKTIEAELYPFIAFEFDVNYYPVAAPGYSYIDEIPLWGTNNLFANKFLSDFTYSIESTRKLPKDIRITSGSMSFSSDYDDEYTLPDGIPSDTEKLRGFYLYTSGTSTGNMPDYNGNSNVNKVYLGTIRPTGSYSGWDYSGVEEVRMNFKSDVFKKGTKRAYAVQLGHDYQSLSNVYLPYFDFYYQNSYPYIINEGFLYTMNQFTSDRDFTETRGISLDCDYCNRVAQHYNGMGITFSNNWYYIYPSSAKYKMIVN